MELLTIDIESSFGSFTKPESTTGGLLSYRVPPKPAIIGIIGSLLGLSFEDTQKTFKDLKVGIQPLNQIRTKTSVFNSHYGGRAGRMVNVRQEMLVNPRYRIYLDFDNISTNTQVLNKIQENLHEIGIRHQVKNIFDATKEVLRSKSSYYDLYMGRNNFPLEYILKDKTLEILEGTSDVEFETECIVPKEMCSDFRVEEVAKPSQDNPYSLGLTEPRSIKFYILKDLPVGQNERRDYNFYQDFIMKSAGSGLKLLVKPQWGKSGYTYMKDSHGKLVVLF